jgi:crotonobetainyl-CoA:carnitine CoA-transferase CaiB-like acyl-CoA transferase
VFADEQVQALQIARPVAHPRLGDISLVAQPCEMTGLDRAIRSPTPDLGQHTDQILQGIGYSETAIAALRSDRII